MAAETSKICGRCSALGLTRADFESPPFEPPGKYHQVVTQGTIGDLRLRESECALCLLLLRALSLELEDRPEVLAGWEQVWEAEWYQNTSEYDPAADGVEDEYGSALRPRLLGEATSNYGVQLVDENDTQCLLRARRMPQQIDIAKVKLWLNKCSYEHGKQCSSTYLAIPEHPSRLAGFRVIDVDQQCLVQLSSSVDYTALSYVWGRTNYPLTLNANLTIFQEPGAFARVRLPRTVRDAMEVTSALGFRYLWVDALCIIQDDDEGLKKELINNMDAVYGNSVLTIVAASGNHADAGLEGWHRKDAGHGSTVTLKPGLTLGVVPFFDLELMNSPFASRGWTYQETALSPRKIIFLGEQAYFVCHNAVWREDVMAESDLIQPFDGANTLGSTMLEGPLGCYTSHIQAYSSRKLTYPSDALNAFAGIQKALGQFMGGTQFWYGLPAAAFDWALMWNPPQEERLTRREGFPSWSWSGWTGAVTLPPCLPSSSEQSWLRNRTWIDWYIIDNEGVAVPVWEVDSENQVRDIGPQTNQASDNSTTSGHNERDSDVFDEGRIDNEGDEVVDEEFMPTYGSSRSEDSLTHLIQLSETEKADTLKTFPNLNSSSPYVRMSTSGTQTTEREMQPSSYNPSTGPEHIQGCNPGTLVFKTLAYSPLEDGFTISSPHLVAGHRGAHQIIDDKTGKVCGLIWSAEVLPRPPAMTVPKLLALSFAAPSTVNREELRAVGLDEEYLLTGVRDSSLDGEEVFGEWHEWDFLNVMLIHGFERPARFEVKHAKTQDKGNSLHVVEELLFEAKRQAMGLLHRNVLKKGSQRGRWQHMALN